RIIAAGLWFALLVPAHAQSPIQMVDVSDTVKLSFQHTHGGSGKLYVLEPMSAGLALFDVDADGDVDMYLLNGAPLKGTRTDKAPKNALYRNDGNWTFTDVTDASGLGDTGYGLGVAVGDIDNDGDPDLYLNNYGPNVLYRNNGDGTFTDITAKAGVANGHLVGAGANFLDMDGDGDLDLFVSSYVGFTYENHKVIYQAGRPAYSGPTDYPPTPDSLYRNNGDGTFTDVSAASGIAAHRGTGMGTVCTDVDNDGDIDIYVANDDMGNFLFLNDGAGRFEEMGLLSGAGYEADGEAQSSMGVGCGDYNNDGLIDLFVTGYKSELTALYQNAGDGLFDDVTRRTGAGANTYALVNWGTDFVDFDNDGDRDIFIANGHFEREPEKAGRHSTFLSPNTLLMNDGTGKFVDVSKSSGSGMEVRQSSRGCAFDDLDNDGDIDAVVLNWQERPTLIRNDSPRGQHWLQIRLRGTRTNRGGIGARVKVTAGDLTLVDEVHSGRGYQSHYGERLHFGLGPRDKVDRIEVRWVGGGTDVLTDLTTDRLITITEGRQEID
ncbi:MAG: CRTAC1 family protein, partial [Verrucomicrobiota bacterium]